MVNMKKGSTLELGVRINFFFFAVIRDTSKSDKFNLRSDQCSSMYEG